MISAMLLRRYCSAASSKVAVITGGASGIGLALAKRALASNYKVVLADIDVDALGVASTQLGAPDRILTVKCDVTVENDIKNLAEKAFDRFGE